MVLKVIFSCDTFKLSKLVANRLVTGAYLKNEMTCHAMHDELSCRILRYVVVVNVMAGPEGHGEQGATD